MVTRSGVKVRGVVKVRGGSHGMADWGHMVGGGEVGDKQSVPFKNL